MDEPKPPLRVYRESPRLSDHLRVIPQYLIPQHLLSVLMFRLTRIGARPWKDWLVRWYCRHYRVDLSSVAEPDPLVYPDFNSFFTRALRPNVRPLPGDHHAIACPADGRLVVFGDIDHDRLLQAKGRDYTLEELLGGASEQATWFRNGRFATVYLSPGDYHRVHMPFTGRLQAVSYIPGRLFSVNASTARLVPRLFARNERVVAIFATRIGPMAIIMVGAIFVGSIETVWAGTLTPPYIARPQHWEYDSAGGQVVELERGAEMGRFNMGSTVIVLLPQDAVRWSSQLVPGIRILTGEMLGLAVGLPDTRH